MILNWPWLKYYHRKCPDGTIVMIYKDPDEAFPMALKDEQRGIVGELTAYNKIKGKLSSDSQVRINGLLLQLDELNQGIILDFRALYVAFGANPCLNSRRLQDQIEDVIKEQRNLRKISIQIKSLITIAQTNPADTSQFLAVFKSIADQIGGKPQIEATKMEIAENRDRAVLWSTSKIDS